MDQPSTPIAQAHDDAHSAHAQTLRTINGLYLSLVRETARADLGSACAEFEIDPDTAKLIRDMPLVQLQALVQTPKVLVRPTLGARNLAMLVSADETHRRSLAVLTGA